MPKALDLTGKKFGMLSVVEDIGRKDGGKLYLCKCECGNKKACKSEDLTRGRAKSCGCLKTKILEAEIFTKTRPELLTTKIYTTNSSGVRGVYFNKEKSKWSAEITFRGKKYFLGYFSNLESAKKARLLAEEKYWGPVNDEWNKQVEL